MADGGTRNVAELSAALGLPVATAHRQVRTLVERGYLTAIAKGRHVAGARLIRLGLTADPLTTLCHVARRELLKLTRETGGAAHLGVLEHDMVTYLVKVGPAGERLFTQEGKQLEAYCSGIGKVLLAYLPEVERERYLADGPFTALTERTITDPTLLRAELSTVRQRGYAVDDGEIAPAVRCVAVPLLRSDGTARAAISITRLDALASAAETPRLVEALQAIAARFDRTLIDPLVSAECYPIDLSRASFK